MTTTDDLKLSGVEVSGTVRFYARHDRAFIHEDDRVCTADGLALKLGECEVGRSYALILLDDAAPIGEVLSGAKEWQDAAWDTAPFASGDDPREMREVEAERRDDETGGDE